MYKCRKYDRNRLEENIWETLYNLKIITAEPCKTKNRSNLVTSKPESSLKHCQTCLLCLDQVQTLLGDGAGLQGCKF